MLRSLLTASLLFGVAALLHAADAEPDALVQPKKDKKDPKKDPKAEPKGDGDYKLVDEMKGDRSLVGLQAAISPDASRIALFNPKAGATGQSEVAIWDFKEKKVIARLAPKGLGHRLEWSADGSTLVSSWFGESAKFGDPRKPDTVTVWDTADWKEKATFELESTHRPAISGDGSVLAVGSKSLTSDKPGIVVFYDVANKKELRRLEAGSIGHDPAVVLSRDGKSAVLNAHVKDTALSVVDLKTWKPKVSFPKGRWPFALSADGKTLVATHSDSIQIKGKFTAREGVVVYDTANAKSGKEYLFENQGGVALVGLLDKGQLAVLAGSLADVRILDTKTGKVVDRITPVKGMAVMNMRVSADSSRIMVLGGDYKTRIYSTPFEKKP
jgi:WD40 repeat protein